MPAIISTMKSAGEVGNITTVAGAGLRLALLLNAVACQVATLGVDIHSISKGISLFSTSLKQLGQSLQAEHSVHTQECLNTAHQISDQARTVFEEIEDMLEKVQKAENEPDKKDVPVQQRFKECFKKQRVTYLLAQMEVLKLSLMVMVQILQLGRLQEVKSVLNTLTDELIVQERADAQNMLVVRYWSTKRLDRLWELALQEAKEDRCGVHFSSNEQPSAPTGTAESPPLNLKRYSIVPLGVESSLRSMEDSPNDMLRLTQEVLDALLVRWIRVEAGQRVGPVPRAYVSSESDDALSDDDSFDRNSMHGYYIEGVTTDWRRPHSQEARAYAAQLRKMYSDKQARVHSDSEGSEDSVAKSARVARKKNKGYASSDNEELLEQVQMDGSTAATAAATGYPHTSRPYSFSPINEQPRAETENSWRNTNNATRSQQTPVQTSTRPINIPRNAAPNNTLNVNYGANPDRLATSQPGARSGPSSPSPRYVPFASSATASSSYYPPTSNGFPTAASGYKPQQQQQPYLYPQPPQLPTQQQYPQYGQYSNQSPSFTRSQSDNTVLQPPQAQQPYLVPPNSSHRCRSSRNNRTSKGSHKSSGSGGGRSPSPYDRRKDLKRTAMRGLLGASAIGGFMDALEAFSII